MKEKIDGMIYSTQVNRIMPGLWRSVRVNVNPDGGYIISTCGMRSADEIRRNIEVLEKIAEALEGGAV